MISRTHGDFWRLYAQLSSENKRAASRAFARFRVDPGHPSLRFKKLAGRGDIWSVRVNDDIRAAGRRQGDTIRWFWIGTHNEFDNLFSDNPLQLLRFVRRLNPA